MVVSTQGREGKCALGAPDRNDGDDIRQVDKACTSIVERKTQRVDGSRQTLRLENGAKDSSSCWRRIQALLDGKEKDQNDSNQMLHVIS